MATETTAVKQIFDNESINNLANILLKEGFDIIQHESKDNWFSYHKDGNIAYFQFDKFQSYTISTVHKPNAKVGTGFRMLDLGVDPIHYVFIEPTIKDFEEGFVFAPSWASESDRKEVKKYESLADFIKKPSSLEYKVIRSNK